MKNPTVIFENGVSPRHSMKRHTACKLLSAVNANGISQYSRRRCERAVCSCDVCYTFFKQNLEALSEIR